MRLYDSGAFREIFDADNLEDKDTVVISTWS